ncbi:MerR family transcriptional regulator [Brucella sp. 2716]|uniref:MerR family transcriptional regulator n=1 Tax=Brucella sp. 2716 TaxID=2975052 RepID=UPI00217CF51B|nr:MerR family transcriptional regulator [Brucella sp. 2716]UWF60262.1 MerR family transcriptional regulator [Brucella sp. 2716]
MKIGELAKRSGLAASRIRFYESIGLLRTVDRRSNGYRTYPEEAVLVLHLIATAQKAGFSLDEIRTLLPPDLDNWEHGALIEVLRRKVADIEALESRLARSKLQLLGLISDIEAKPDDMACADNARRVLSRLMAEEMEAPASQQDEGRTHRRTII